MATAAVALGGLILVFRAAFARFLIEEQNAAWGFQFGERGVKAAKSVLVIVGLGFIVWGVLFFIAERSK